MSIQPGQTLLNGKYHILRLIGEGGMARVWLAEEPGFGGRKVAIKEPLLAQLGPDEQQELERRFRQEIKLAPQLEQAHVPNVVRTYTVERLPDGTQLLVMEYIDGGSLAERIAAQPHGLPIEQALSITQDVLRALDGFHRLPGAPVHRDVKPENILLDAQGRARLSDLGLAQLAGVSSRSQLMAGPHPGTPLYMAPEQGRGPDPLTPAADLYALGCVLFEMLTGKRYKRVRPGTAPSSLRPDLPHWLDAVVLKALTEDPWDRYQTAGEMAAALRQPAVRARPPEPVRREPVRPASSRGWVWAIVIIISLVVAIGLGVGIVALLDGLSGSVPPGREVTRTATKPPPTPTVTEPPTPTATVGPTDTPASEPIAVQSLPTNRIIYNTYLYMDEYTTSTICGMRADGSEHTCYGRDTFDLKAGDYMSDYAPSWSPDGQWVAFQAIRTGADGYNHGSIRKMRADGSGVTLLIEDSERQYYDPKWSPDGQWIALTAMTRNNSYDVYKIRPDGTELTLLAHSEELDELGSWSPDGRKIVFLSGRDGSLELYVMNADGSGQTRLTHAGIDGGYPDWSPDGQWIAFPSEQNGERGIFLITPDGSELKRLTTGPDWDPAWSPDGHWLAFTSERDGDPEIYLMRSDGSEITQLTFNDAMDGNPTWQP